MTPKPKPTPAPPAAAESAWNSMNAKIQQLAARVTRLEEMIMGAIVHASNNPSPPPEPTPAED